MQDGEISLDAAKHAIVTCLEDFDPGLGRRAANILYDSERLNLTEEAARVTGMMQCRPAGLTIADLRSRDIYIENYAERFGPHFTEQENPGDSAVVDFEYVHTKHSVLYLAHEVGHAIADDAQKERGRSFRDFSPDELEEQAYFVQSIVAAKVSPAFNTESASYDAGVPALTTGFNRQSQRYGAYTAFETAQSLSAEQRGAFIRDFLSGTPSERGNEKCAAVPAPIVLRKSMTAG